MFGKANLFEGYTSDIYLHVVGAENQGNVFDPGKTDGGEQFYERKATFVPRAMQRRRTTTRERACDTMKTRRRFGNGNLNSSSHTGEASDARPVLTQRLYVGFRIGRASSAQITVQRIIAQLLPSITAQIEQQTATTIQNQLSLQTSPKPSNNAKTPTPLQKPGQGSSETKSSN